LPAAAVVGAFDGGLLFAFGQDLEQQVGATLVQFHVAELVDLCGHPHRSIYADTATMPRFFTGDARSPDDVGFSRGSAPAGIGIVPG